MITVLVKSNQLADFTAFGTGGSLVSSFKHLITSHFATIIYKHGPIWTHVQGYTFDCGFKNIMLDRLGHQRCQIGYNFRLENGHPFNRYLI